MASNLIVARGAVEYLPPISLAFWRWVLAFIILFLFTHKEIIEKFKYFKKEFFNIFFLGATSAGICGAFPFIAGTTTTVVNMGIIYSSSPIFIVLFSSSTIILSSFDLQSTPCIEKNISFSASAFSLFSNSKLLDTG